MVLPGCAASVQLMQPWRPVCSHSTIGAHQVENRCRCPSVRLSVCSSVSLIKTGYFVSLSIPLHLSYFLELITHSLPHYLPNSNNAAHFLFCLSSSDGDVK